MSTSTIAISFSRSGSWRQPRLRCRPSPDFRERAGARAWRPRGLHSAIRDLEPARLIGRRLGDFTVGELLGAGGGGVIYRAEQRLLGRQAVVKLLPVQDPRQPGGAERVERFLREARLASRLDHPYAAHVYAFGAEPDGVLWIAMERVRGTSLARVLASQPGRRIPVSRFVHLLELICEVVHAAHEQGIIHRDLKPDNIMVLSRAGRLLPKLLDFGVAKQIGEPTRDHDIGEPAAALELTQPGAHLGSPYYMAPEQWSEHGVVDARSDVYGLGVLTFEALTGGVPFRGRTAAELARQHRTADMPALPADLPAALEPVLRAALAKRPDERPASALAFGEAVRAAAGVNVAADTLPRLDAEIRQEVAWMPQPIADVIAAFETACNPHQARDALWQIVHVAARYLGLVALAARSRSGPGGDPDAPVVVALLRELHRRDLTDDEWLALIAALVAPYATAREAYPIPELVDLFARPAADAAAHPGSGSSTELRASSGSIADAGSGSASPPGADPGASSVASGASPAAAYAGSVPAGTAFAPVMAARTREAAAETESSLRDRLVAQLPALVGLLRALAFLTDYQLVVPRAAGGEVWMGPARARRPVIAISSGISGTPTGGISGPRPGEPPGDLAIGAPILVDFDGRPVLQLAPLFQVAAPTPGAAEQLFLFAGGRRDRGSGARLVAEPHGFERADDTVWDWFRAHLLALDDGPPPQLAQAPYRGLRAFTAPDAAMYFGRERAADAFANQLLLQPLVAVVGPSGAGKSSFVQAGVVPRLPAGWRSIVVRPGAAPLSALSALAELPPGASSAGDPATIAAQLRAAAGAGMLVIIVDQFEEVFTLCRDAAARTRFTEVLVQAARSLDDRVRVVLTLRDDFLVRAGELAPLRDRLAQGLTLLATPAPDDLVRVLVEPARRVGYRFDDPALPRAMVDAVAGRPGALALLSFTAARLWELRDRHFHQLTRKAYDAIGGVEGALAGHAEATLLACATDQQRLVREAFRHLVTAEGTREVVARHELIAALGDATHGADVLERLVAARLLVAAESETGEDRIEIVHEALLTSWPRLVEWRREDLDGARLRDQLRAAARQWDERGRPRGLLWRDEALDDYRRWRKRWPGAVPALDLAFATASLGDEARGRRIRRAIIAVAVSVLAAGTTALAVLYRTSNRNAGTAHERLIQSYEEQGRRLLLDGEYLRALPYLAEAYAQGDESNAVRFLLARAERLAGAELATHQHTGRALAAGFRRDGGHVLSVSDDGEAAIWDAATGRVVASLPGRPGGPYYGKVSRDGAFVAIPGRDGVTLWDGDHVRTIGSGRVDRVAIDPGGARIAIAAGGELSAWSVASGERLWTAATSAATTYAAWTGDGVFTAGADRVARISDRQGVTQLAAAGPVVVFAVATGGAIATVSGAAIELWDTTGARRTRFDSQGHTTAAALSADGSSLVLGTEDGILRLYDTATGASTGELVGHRGRVVSIELGDDASRLATAGGDLTVRIWNVADHRQITTLLGARDQYVAAALRFDATGARMVGPTWDGAVRVFATGDPEIETVVDGDEGLDSGQFFDDGRRFATSSPHAFRVWATATGARLGRIELPGGYARISPDGKKVAAVAGGTGEAEIRDVATGGLLSTIHGSGHLQWASFDHASERIITTSDDHLVELWTSDGKLVRTLRGHTGRVLMADFSPDDRQVISASADYTARIWDLASGRELGQVKGGDVMPSAEFDPGGARFLTGNADRIARLWDARTRSLLRSFEHASQLRSATISGDATLVAGATGDGTVAVWDAATSALVAQLHHSASVESVAFSPRADRLLSTSVDHRAVVWRLGLETRSHATVTAFVRCHAPYQLVGTRLEPTAPACPTD
jgi:WD40 repeat protein/tRNA A-37 threonylcarbamoyl transferase component Bud32